MTIPTIQVYHPQTGAPTVIGAPDLQAWTARGYLLALPPPEGPAALPNVTPAPRIAAPKSKKRKDVKP